MADRGEQLHPGLGEVLHVAFTRALFADVVDRHHHPRVIRPAPVFRHRHREPGIELDSIGMCASELDQREPLAIPDRLELASPGHVRSFIDDQRIHRADDVVERLADHRYPGGVDGSDADV